MEIQIKVHHRWKDEEVLVKRIARVVCFTDADVRQQEDGYKWSLYPSANNWWASGLEDGQIKVSYRYGTEELMAALKTFLEWALG